MRTTSLLNVGPVTAGAGEGCRTARCRPAKRGRAKRSERRTSVRGRMALVLECASSMGIHIVLVHPEIHWSTGNAGRSCLAAGATLHLIEPLGFSLDEREVRRAGLDYWEHVDVRVWPDWQSFEQVLPSLGEPLFFSTRAERAFRDAQLGV